MKHMKTTNPADSLTEHSFLLLLVMLLYTNCSRSGDAMAPVPPVTPNPPVTNEIDFWLTKPDESVKLQKQSTILAFGTTVNQYANIEVDENAVFQTVDGFGY